MSAFLTLLICSFIALFLQALLHAYFYIPERELKRRAGRGKTVFQRLRLVTHYGNSARYFLSFLSFIFVAATVIIISRTVSPLLALILLGIFASLLKFASTKNSFIITKLAARFAPLIARILAYIQPLADGITKVLPKQHKHVNVTDIYEKEDLKNLLQLQKKAPNNRIENSDLDSAIKSLDFAAATIKDLMVLRDKIRFVKAKEPIGPILLSELHKSGFSCFPVQGNSENEVVGMLHIQELAEHTTGGVVVDAMDSHVVYVNEDQSLNQVLQAFAETGKHVFIVVNDQSDIVGLITVTDVLERLLGHPIRPSRQDFEDSEAIAQD